MLALMEVWGSTVGETAFVGISTAVGEHETSTVTTIIDRSIFVFICLPLYARNYRSQRTIPSHACKLDYCFSRHYDSETLEQLALFLLDV